jgi:PAS domain S-box-containing protein
MGITELSLLNLEISFLHAAPLAVAIVVPTGRVSYANPNLEAMFGYGSGELAGQLVELLMPVHYRATHLQHRHHYAQIPHMRNMGLELIGLRKDGSEFPIEAELSYFQRNGETFLLATIVDISLRKRTEAQIAYQACVLANVSDAVVSTDAQHSLTSWNAAAEAMYGWRATEAIGQQRSEVMRADSSDDQQAAIRHTLETTGCVQVEVAHYRKDGTPLTVEETTIAVRDAAGQITDFVTLSRDITERKQTAALLEHRVAERTHELERRRQAADGLHYILTLINSNRPVKEVLDRIVVHATELLGAAACLIYQVQGDHLLLQVSYGFTDPALGQSTLPLNEQMRRLLAQRHPLAIPDLAHFPLHNESVFTRRSQVLANGYQGVLAIPLILKEQPYGCLVAYYHGSHQFQGEEIDLARALGHQAVLALENDDLHTQIERTAVAAERNRIAGDLHDAVHQTLFSASLIAESLPKIWSYHPEEGRRCLDELRALTRGALAEMQTLLLELRPAQLLETGLSDLLRQLAAAAAGRLHILVTVQIVGETVTPAAVKLAFYRIAQEAVNNIAKHARAHHAEIKLQSTVDSVVLSIVDDGRGFSLERVPPPSLGLMLIRQYAAAIGATLQMQSEPGQGTTVAVRWPQLMA